MNRMIKLAVSRPLSCIALLIVLTGVFSFGMKYLRIDPSTEALMPRHVEEYLYNMRMKKVFGDSKLFLLSLIESGNGKLLTNENFVEMNEIVEEIEEFHTFDYEAENKRLETLLRLGAVVLVENVSAVNADEEGIPEQGKEEIPELSEDDLDEILTGGSFNEASLGNSYFDVFAIDQSVPDDINVNPIREKRNFSLDLYTHVSLFDLKETFDVGGLRQLNTVLKRLGLEDIPESYVFSSEEYSLILDEFETAYLYKSMEAVKNFMNPITGEDIIGTADSLTPVDLVETDDNDRRMLPEGEADFDSYRERLFANPSFQDMVYTLDENGSVSSLAINIQLQVMENPEYLRDYFIDMFDKYNKGSLEYTPVGIPVFEYYIQSYMKKDMRKFMPLVFLVIIITFFLNFRTAGGVILPTLSIIMSILWTVGLMGYLNIPLTMVVNIMPTILVAVGSSYSIHILNQYFNDQQLIREVGKEKGLVSSMVHISVTVLLAALTTFIGFMTLGFSQVVSLKHFGIFSAIGTVFAMFIASTLIPAVLSLKKVSPEKKKEKDKNSFLQYLLVKSGILATNYPVPVLLVSAVILLVSVFGVFRLGIESAPTFNFKDNSYVVKSDQKVSSALKGTLPINLMIDTGRTGGVKDPEFLKKLDELANWAVSGECHSKYNLLDSFTFCDIIKRMNKAMNSGDPDYYSIPDDITVIEDYLMLYSGEDRDSDGLPDNMERFVDPQYRVANVFIKTGYYNGQPYTTERLLAGVDYLNRHLAEDPYFSKLKFQAAGQPINYSVLNRLIASGQVITIILTLITIAAIIFILFRDFKAALVSLLPISCSILIVYGIMGYFNIPLDTVKSIIAAITIGIGIDDTIHMLKTIRYNLLQGKDLKTAIMESYHEAGKAIAYTSVSLIFGFSILMFSEFKILFFLGLLVAMNMLITTIAALVILPAAVWILKINFNVNRNITDKKTEMVFEGENTL